MPEAMRLIYGKFDPQGHENRPVLVFPLLHNGAPYILSYLKQNQKELIDTPGKDTDVAWH